MDKNNDDFVTLEELNAFSWAVYKKKWLTQGELRNQHWILKNLYPKDILGSDNQFDADEYWYYLNTKTTTPGPGWTTPSPPTTRLKFVSKFYSEKPAQFWDANGSGGIDHDEKFRFKPDFGKDIPELY